MLHGFTIKTVYLIKATSIQSKTGLFQTVVTTQPYALLYQSI